MQVFGSSGARGVVGEGIDPGFVCDIARAAGEVWATDRVAVARDTRYTGRMLANAVAAGFASVGVDVQRLGELPTPGLQSHCARTGIPGLMVTASHNPPEYNGVKLVDEEGIELSVESLEAIEKSLLDETDPAISWADTGVDRQIENATDCYVDELVTAVDRRRIEDADLTVAVDPGHGAGALTTPTVLRRLGCDVRTVNAHPDGHFPGRDPEPVRENLGDLQHLVAVSDADIGVAHDGDGDRAIFIDESGNYVEGDAALAALAERELTAGDVAVSAVNVSQRLVDVVERVDAKLELTPIGSTRILDRVRSLRATGESVPIAGEGNGGIIFPGYRLARDGAYTTARFLELAAEQPVSAVIEPYDDYENVRVNVEYESDGEREAMLAAAQSHTEDTEATVTTTDGFRLDYGDSWVLARPSGTEPLVRLYAEARDEERATTLAAEFTDVLVTARDGA